MKNNTFYHIFILVLSLFLPCCFGPTQSYPTIQKIIFISSRFGANMEIYTMDTDGNNLVNLTNNPGKDFGGNFEPDGSSITFTSFRDTSDETSEIFIVDIDGRNLIKVSNYPGAEDFALSF